MSLHPRVPGEIPAQTAQIARQAFPKGCLRMRLRDTLGPMFADQEFLDLFPQRGQPAWPPHQLAVVSVLQFLEDLSDRQAAAAVRARIIKKVTGYSAPRRATPTSAWRSSQRPSVAKRTPVSVYRAAVTAPKWSPRMALTLVPARACSASSTPFLLAAPDPVHRRRRPVIPCSPRHLNGHLHHCGVQSRNRGPPLLLVMDVSVPVSMVALLIGDRRSRADHSAPYGLPLF
jgi:hypothetical protein